MKISNQRSIFLFLIFFSIYCALNVGLTWDEDFLIYTQGKRAVDYLFSLGKINEDIFRGEYYSPIYYSIKYFFINMLPLKFRVEVSYLINLFFSFLAIIGIKKLTELLFNRDVGKITFLVLFFYPVFFGHMAFNSKDTIIALCHVWIFYLLLRYIKNGNKNKSSINNFYLIGILAAVGSGINLFFLGSLIPVAVIVLLEIYFIKKIINKNFDLKIFYLHIIKAFLLFYFVLILFWIDTHPNILTLPVKLFSDWAFGDLFRGYPFMLFNGNHYIITDVPKSYLILNLLYRSPEYFLFSYILFVFIFFISNFFKKNFRNFNYKILIIFLMIINPFIIVLLTPFSIYDGLRHVLWLIPYICIIPGLVIYYLLKNINSIKVKIAGVVMFLLFFVFFLNFLILTPYQYTYLNLFNGNSKNFIHKFENDYWGSSAKELISKINFDKNTEFTYGVCGINRSVVEMYLKKRGFVNSRMETPNKSEYIFMTNRAVVKDEKGLFESNNVSNCYSLYSGINVFEVKRKNVVLTVMRKIN